MSIKYYFFIYKNKKYIEIILNLKYNTCNKERRMIELKKEEITIKNTKAEILEALNAALEREKNIQSTKSNPEKEEKVKRVEKAIETSRENVEQKIFSEELIKKFNDLELAISAEEEKLKELYGVENELNNLTIVINAGKDCIAEIETKKELKTEELNNEIKELETKFNQKSEELKTQYDEMAKRLKVERDREIEEYEYKTKREREISNNKWNDDKIERESKLAKAEEETLSLLEEAKQKVEHIKELEERVNEIPVLLEKEYSRGKKEATADLEREHKYQVELLTKDYTNQIDRLNDKIDSLNKEIENVNNLNKNLQDKMDKAYIELKELATKTVESAGGVKIIGNNGSEN